MDNCLLIGNGLNRTLEHSIPWSDLLKDIADELGTSYCSDNILPLEFERIVNEYLKKCKEPDVSVYSDIKKKVANKLSFTLLPDTAIHKIIPSIPIDSIITTNYDYLIEQAFEKDFLIKEKTNKKYLMSPVVKIDNIDFFHAHGICAYPQSICLGYEHYAGIVYNLRENLNKKDNNKNEEMAIKKRLLGESSLQNKWGEKFYTSNIDIIGLSLDSCEIDLWWLLTHRACLYYSNYCGLKKSINNTITFYDVIDDIKKNSVDEETRRYSKELIKRQKYNLLKGYNVAVKIYSLSEYGTYCNAYSKMLDDVKKKNTTIKTK